MTKMLIPRTTTPDDHHPGNGKNTNKKIVLRSQLAPSEVSYGAKTV